MALSWTLVVLFIVFGLFQLVEDMNNPLEYGL